MFLVEFDAVGVELFPSQDVLLSLSHVLYTRQTVCTGEARIYRSYYDREIGKAVYSRASLATVCILPKSEPGLLPFQAYPCR